MRSRPASSQNGLTLIETMVVVAVLGVLLALAAPSFRNFIATQQLKGAANELMTDMVFARSEALARQGDVASPEEIRVIWSKSVDGKSVYTISRFKNSNEQLPPLRKVTLDSELRLSLFDGYLVFDSLRGMASGVEVTLTHEWLASDVQLKLTVNAMGVPCLWGKNISGVKSSCPL